MLEFDGLHKSFGSNRVLEGVSFAGAQFRTDIAAKAEAGQISL